MEIVSPGVTVRLMSMILQPTLVANSMKLLLFREADNMSFWALKAVSSNLKPPFCFVVARSCGGDFE